MFSGRCWARWSVFRLGPALFETGKYQLLIYSSLLILAMLVLPNGLLSIRLDMFRRPKQMSALLEVKGVTKRFGGLTANNDITFQVPKTKSCR